MGKFLWVIALGLMTAGIWQGDAGRVLVKASLICMECIGIG